jgi:hypothetical protein
MSSLPLPHLKFHSRFEVRGLARRFPLSGVGYMKHAIALLALCSTALIHTPTNAAEIDWKAVDKDCCSVWRHPPLWSAAI